jgi:hypothetical protein
VPCTASGTECKAGQVCCFSTTSAADDHCGTKGQCGDDYVELDCNDKSDCPGEVCCTNLSDNLVSPISCQPTCTASGDHDVCSSLQSCLSTQGCAPFIPGYMDYGICVSTE